VRRDDREPGARPAVRAWIMGALMVPIVLFVAHFVLTRLLAPVAAQ
jgi:hypothetical protein